MALIATGSGLHHELFKPDAATDADAPPVIEAPVIEVIAGSPLPFSAATPIEVPAPVHPVVEIAICLDTSGSMDGLIDAARQKLWGIVNEFVFAEPMPTLRVALLTYGNDGHNAENGWVKLETGLTEDLDLVSQILFAQTTNGGTELVGRVVSAATRQLQWSQEPGALKLIVVAGNESADQDTAVPFSEASKAAITADIMVNAIYCGAPGHVDALQWRQVALLADGQFAAIDHNNGTVVMQTPFDARVAELSAGLNRTYLAFGVDASTYAMNQRVQDENAVGLNGEAAASRAICKSNLLYNCASWDLVDAARQPNFVLADIDAKLLPLEMQAMTLEERQAHIELKGSERAELQKQVNALALERQAFIDEQTQKQQLDDSKSFDNAFKQALRSQARSRGDRFSDAKPNRAPAQAPVLPAATPAELGGC